MLSVLARGEVVAGMPQAPLCPLQLDSVGVAGINLPGVDVSIPREWPLLEEGLKQYHRLLQERAAAAKQVQTARVPASRRHNQSNAHLSRAHLPCWLTLTAAPCLGCIPGTH